MLLVCVDAALQSVDSCKATRYLRSMHVSSFQSPSRDPSSPSVLEELELSDNQFTRLPSLGSASRLTRLVMDGNPRLELSVDSMRRLATEAPNLRLLQLGSSVAAAPDLLRELPNLFIS